MDSTVAFAIAKSEGFDVHALSFDYGQRHRYELDAARTIARELGAREHRIVRLDLSVLGGSALTSSTPVPKDRSAAAIAEGVPATYVPARNTIFLSVALGWAEIVGARDLFIGVNAVDYSGYPDCRPEFVAAFEALARVATVAGAEHKEQFRVRAPLIELSKAAIVRRGLELGVDFALTHTCYDPRPSDEPLARADRFGGRSTAVLACGRCDACRLRLDGFAAAGAADPLRYAGA